MRRLIRFITTPEFILGLLVVYALYASYIYTLVFNEVTIVESPEEESEEVEEGLLDEPADEAIEEY